MTPPIDRTRRIKIGLFFKRPVPGEVKTRLIPDLTPVQAARLYEAFLLDTIETCRSIGEAETVLFDGSPSPATWSSLPADLPLHPQTGDDLGARMTAALDVLLDHGAGKALLVGSDSPSLPSEFIRDAIARLDRADLVLGPVEDGGFYLVGVTRPPGSLLESIPWSTSSVLGDTTTRARRLGFSLEFSPPWFDMDTVDDVKRLHSDGSSSNRAPRSRTAIEALWPLKSSGG